MYCITQRHTNIYIYIITLDPLPRHKAAPAGSITQLLHPNEWEKVCYTSTRRTKAWLTWHKFALFDSALWRRCPPCNRCGNSHFQPRERPSTNMTSVGSGLCRHCIDVSSRQALYYSMCVSQWFDACGALLRFIALWKCVKTVDIRIYIENYIRQWTSALHLLYPNTSNNMCEILCCVTVWHVD